MGVDQTPTNILTIGKSALAGRAIERRPARLHNAGDGRAAAGCDAGLVFTAIDLKTMLKIPQFAISLPKIAQAAAACLDGIGQHLADDRHQPRHLTRRQIARLGHGGNTGTIERFAHIDIAKPGHHMLIQQRRFDRHRPPFQPRHQIRLVKGIA